MDTVCILKKAEESKLSNIIGFNGQLQKCWSIPSKNEYLVQQTFGQSKEQAKADMIYFGS